MKLMDVVQIAGVKKGDEKVLSKVGAAFADFGAMFGFLRVQPNRHFAGMDKSWIHLCIIIKTVEARRN